MLQIHIIVRVVFLFLIVSFPAQAQQSLSANEMLLLDQYKSVPMAGVERETLQAKALDEFAGRGPALARHFLNHRSPPFNDSYFFLFSLIGDVETAQMLIHALPNPPTPKDSVLQRHSGEIEVAIENVLKREEVRTDIAVHRALEETLAETRKLAWGDYPSKLLISLMGRLGTAQAVQSLKTLAKDSDPAIRSAVLSALGRTSAPSAEQILAEAMSKDDTPSVRADAAKAIRETANENTAFSLLDALEQETDLKVVDSILQSLSALQTAPQDADTCLKMAKRGWDINAVRPYFNCWQKTVSRSALVEQAISGTWAVRALAIEKLMGKPATTGPLRLMRQPDKEPFTPDEATRDKLLNSAVAILSQEMLAPFTRNSISHETAEITKQALWEVSGHDMELALSYADRIEPLSGRYDYIGRFGASSYLASQNETAYTNLRRPVQLLSAVLLLFAAAPLLIGGKTRKPGVALLAGISMWVVVILFEGGVHRFPPPPLGFLTVPAISLVVAGMLAALVAMMTAGKWIKLVIAPLAAGFTVLFVCGYTRWQGLYPIGDGGWALYFDPIGSALLAAPAAFLITLGLLFWPKAQV